MKPEEKKAWDFWLPHLNQAADPDAVQWVAHTLAMGADRGWSGQLACVYGGSSLDWLIEQCWCAKPPNDELPAALWAVLACFTTQEAVWSVRGPPDVLEAYRDARIPVSEGGQPWEWKPVKEVIQTRVQYALQYLPPLGKEHQRIEAAAAEADQEEDWTLAAQLRREARRLRQLERQREAFPKFLEYGHLLWKARHAS